MSGPVAGFFSGFTGSAAVETYLLGYAGRPPAAYMGAKTQYRQAIGGALGLRRGHPIKRHVWCDAGPWGMVWQTLADPDAARAVAAMLRAWSDEDPVELWTRLARSTAPESAEARAASALWVQARAAACVPVRYRDGIAETPKGYDRRDEAWRPACQKGRTADGFGGVMSTATVAARVEAAASFLAKLAGSYASDASGGPRGLHSQRPNPANLFSPQVSTVADRVVSPVGNLDIVNDDIDVALALLPEDLAGWIAYLDPPYVGCTPYAADCPRDRVVAIALDLANRGAVVAVSEGVPIGELTAAGWHALDIGHVRRSQRWTARQAGEWLTMSREPTSVPARQGLLFGAVS